MGLQLKLDSLDEISEELKPLYKEASGGGYELQVEGLEDTGALKRAKDYEKEARKAAEQAAKEASEKLREIEERLKQESEEKEKKKAKDSNDWDSYEKSLREQHQKEIDKLKSQFEPKLSEYEEKIEQMTVGMAAKSIAGKIAIDAHAAENIEDYIRSRMRTDLSSEKPRPIVLDRDGNPTALTLEEFEAEIKEMPRFQHVISGSKATGGGANGGGGGAGKRTISRSDFDALSPAEKQKVGMSKEVEIVDN